MYKFDLEKQNMYYFYPRWSHAAPDCCSDPSSVRLQTRVRKCHVIRRGIRPTAYTHRWVINPQFEPSFSIVPHLDIFARLCLQILDIVFDRKTWHIINFYHNMWDISSLQALVSLDIDTITSILVVGDFNTHSPSWSPQDISQSVHAGWIEEWAAMNLLTLANIPREITQRGANHKRDSVIDLIWYNKAAI